MRHPPPAVRRLIGIVSFGIGRRDVPDYAAALQEIGPAAIKFIEGVEIANRPLLLLAVLLIVVGVQLISLGLIGELVVRTYYEAQSKSIYVVREEVNGVKPA